MWDPVKGGSVGDQEGVNGLGGVGDVACGHPLVLDCGDGWDLVAVSTGSLGVKRGQRCSWSEEQELLVYYHRGFMPHGAQW